MVEIKVSTGGLDSIQKLFEQLPNDGGLSFVVDQNQIAHGDNLSCELLEQYTEMKVYWAEDKQEIRPNCIYLCKKGEAFQVNANRLSYLKMNQKQDATLSLFDAIEDLVYVADPETYELVFVNQKLKEALNCEGPVTGEKCYAVLQGAESPCDFCTNEIIFDKQPKETYLWEFQNRINKRWYRCADRSISWADGRELRLEIAIDITKEKENRLALEASEERYHLATTASDNGIWDWWVGESEVYYTDQWKAQLGYQPHELKNEFKTWEKLLHPDCKDRMIKRVQEFLNDPSDYFLEEFRMMHKDGTHRWIQNRAATVQNENGHVVRMFGAHKDITEKREAQEELRKTDLMYRGIIENAPDGVVVVSEEGQFKFVSPSAQRIFGYSHEQLIHLQPGDLSHPEDAGKVKEIVRKVARDELQGTPTAQFRFLTEAGEWKWVESTFSKSADEDGNLAVVINFRDIDERKEYEWKLVEAKKKAELANFQKNYFLANMSHELRTPMNGVIGFSDLLKDDSLEPEKRQHYLRIIEGNAKQLLNLIDDIIDVAKIESNELKIKKGNCQPSTVIHELEELFNQLIDDKRRSKIRFVSHIPENGDTIILHTDCSRLRQVISNLLSNALKYSGEGTVNFGFRIENESIVFYVSDEGPGIPKDKQTEVFERFKQINYDNAAKYGGTGLGLAICKGIVGLLGGEIWLESEENEGSTFSFSLPIDFAEGLELEVEQRMTSGNKNILDNKKLIIAEDDLSIQLYFEELLKNENCQVLFAKDGIEAVDLYRSNPDTHLVLMDIRMPNLGGFEAIRNILEIDPKAKIIAHNTPGDRRLAASPDASSTTARLR